MDINDYMNGRFNDKLGEPTSIRTWNENGMTIIEKIWETENGTVKVIEARSGIEESEYDDESTEGFVKMGNLDYKIDDSMFFDPFAGINSTSSLDRINDMFEQFINYQGTPYSDPRVKKSIGDIGKKREMTVEEEVDLIDMKISFAVKNEEYEKAASLKKMKEELLNKTVSSSNQK